MYSIAIIASTLATLTTASPITSRKTSSLSATSFNYGCSPGGCAWAFNISAPTSSSNFPSFGPTYCSGTGYQTYFVSCDTISDTQSVAAWVEANSTTRLLHIQYEVNADGEARYDYYADTTFELPALGLNFEVPVTSVTAVAKRSIDSSFGIWQNDDSSSESV